MDIEQKLGRRAIVSVYIFVKVCSLPFFLRHSWIVVFSEKIIERKNYLIFFQISNVLTDD